MTQLSKLKSATTLKEVAELLGYKPSALSYLLYVKPDLTKYTKFEIPKRYGGMRQICAPSDDLKLLQRQLATLLQDCIEEINRDSGKNDNGSNPDRISHGFKRRRSIFTNAYQHRDRRYVFNIDIENFFGSINFGRVRGFFILDENFQLHPKAATILAQISCYENSLPQGSPTSPVISNLIGHILDIHLARLSMQVGCTYSRYADDLTFSTNKSIFPQEIAYRSDSDEHIWLPGVKLSKLIHKNGFSINPRKTHMQYQDSRQEVTGLIVNKKVNVKSEYRHTVRAMVHRLLTTGSFEFERYVDENGLQGLISTPGEMNQLHGMLGFVNWTDQLNAKRFGNTNAERRSKEQVYRRFLIYKELYAAHKPVIICEGKTDNIYIRHAILRLARNYPELAAIDSEETVSILIRLFKYTNTSTGRILGIKGGSGDLKYFIKTYHDDSLKFKAPGMINPVIMLVDNDSGAKDVCSMAKQIVKNEPDRTAPFTHITKNLYLVFTPLLDGAQESIIEDLFNDSVKNKQLGVKTFNPHNDFDPSKHYGKSVFACKIVEPNADTIDFTRFSPLLDRFVSVLKYHENHLLIPSV